MSISTPSFKIDYFNEKPIERFYIKTALEYRKTKRTIDVIDSSSSYFPGVSHLVFGSSSIVSSLTYLKKALHIRDSLGILDALTHGYCALLGVAQAITQVLSNFFTTPTQALFTKSTSVLGGFLCGMEAVHEGFALREKFKYLKHTRSAETTSRSLLIKDLAHIKKYFYLTKKDLNRMKQIPSSFDPLSKKWKEERRLMIHHQMDVKTHKLARRLTPDLVPYVDEKLSKIFDRIKTRDPKNISKGLKKAGRLIHKLHTLCQQKVVTHSIALCAALLGLVGFIFALCGLGMPGFIIVTLAGILSLAGYLLTKKPELLTPVLTWWNRQAPSIM
jgi:hypothetical protein